MEAEINIVQLMKRKNQVNIKFIKAIFRFKN